MPKGRQRVYTCNDNFFSIPNPVNCYWAGFLAADGCIKHSGTRRKIAVVLQRKDAAHLEQLLKDLSASNPVHLRTCKSYGKEVETAAVYITSPQLVSDLARNFNVVPAKSKTLQPPNIKDEKLLRCFIAGYIDGDGFISRKRLQLGVSGGSFDFMNWIAKYFSNLVNHPVNIITAYDCLRVILNGRYAQQAITSFQQLSIPLMKRKWDFDLRLPASILI